MGLKLEIGVVGDELETDFLFFGYVRLWKWWIMPCFGGFSESGVEGLRGKKP